MIDKWTAIVLVAGIVTFSFAGIASEWIKAHKCVCKDGAQ